MSYDVALNFAFLCSLYSVVSGGVHAGLYMHIIRGTLPLDAPHNMIYTPCFFTYKFRQLLVSPYASVFWASSGSVPKISMPYGLCQASAFSLLSFPESKKGLYTLVSKASSGSAPKIPMYIAPVFSYFPCFKSLQHYPPSILRSGKRTRLLRRQ